MEGNAHKKSADLPYSCQAYHSLCNLWEKSAPVMCKTPNGYIIARQNPFRGGSSAGNLSK